MVVVLSLSSCTPIARHPKRRHSDSPAPRLSTARQELSGLRRSPHGSYLNTPMSPDAQGPISVTLNGETREVPAGLTVRTLLVHLGVPSNAAVERNLVLVPRGQHAETAVQAGDRFEVVHLVGGG